MWTLKWNGTRVPLCNIPPARRLEYVEYKDFSLMELKKMSECVCGVEKHEDGFYYPIKK